MSKGDQTKARLIEKTAELIATQGYHATGLNQITQESSTPMGSLYYHFRHGKDELVGAAMQSGGNAISAAMQQIFNASTNVPTAIQQLASLFANQMTVTNFQKGCPVATVTLEEAAQNDAIQQVAHEIYQGWQEQIAQFLEKLGYSKEQSSALALLSLSVIEGALLLSRAERSTLPLNRASEYLSKALEVLKG